MRRNAAVIIGVLSTLILGSLACAQDSVRLEYRLSQGELMRYRVNCKIAGGIMDIGGSGSGMITDGILRLRVSKVLPNGDAEIRAAYERGTFKAIGQTKNISADYVSPVTFVVARNGAVRDSDKVFSKAGEVTITKQDGKGGRESVKSNVFAPVVRVIFQEMPDRELRAGDTWKPSIDGLGVSASLPVQSKLISIDAKSSSAIISTTGSGSETSQMRNYDGSSAGSMTVKMAINSRTFFSLAAGRVLAANDSIQIGFSSGEAESSGANTTISTQATLLLDPQSK